MRLNISALSKRKPQMYPSQTVELVINIANAIKTQNTIAYRIMQTTTTFTANVQPTLVAGLLNRVRCGF